jgi:hypothetical protein
MNFLSADRRIATFMAAVCPDAAVTRTLSIAFLMGTLAKDTHTADALIGRLWILHSETKPSRDTGDTREVARSDPNGRTTNEESKRETKRMEKQKRGFF